MKLDEQTSSIKSETCQISKFIKKIYTVHYYCKQKRRIYNVENCKRILKGD